VDTTVEIPDMHLSDIDCNSLGGDKVILAYDRNRHNGVRTAKFAPFAGDEAQGNFLWFELGHLLTASFALMRRL
jgi:hypothetical protein